MKNWWSPLLIPLVVLVAMAVDIGAKGTHVTHDTYATGVLGSAVLAMAIGFPSFWAGTRFARSGRTL